MFSSEGLTKALFFRGPLFSTKVANVRHFEPNAISRSQSSDDVTKLRDKRDRQKKAAAPWTNGDVTNAVVQLSPRNRGNVRAASRCVGGGGGVGGGVDDSAHEHEGDAARNVRLRHAGSLPDVRTLPRDREAKFVSELKLKMAGYGFLRALKRRKMEQKKQVQVRKVSVADCRVFGELTEEWVYIGVNSEAERMLVEWDVI